MATKTISLELDAYEKLKRAKRTPRESFSSVVRRADWDDTLAADALLVALQKMERQHPESFLPDDELDGIEARSRSRERRERPSTEGR